MPNYPKKFEKEYSKNFKVKIPFNMTPEEEENYRQYMFAKMQYEELTSFLNSTNSEIDSKTGEPKGYGKNEFGFEKELDEDMQSLLKEKTENLLNSSKNFIDNLHIYRDSKAGIEGLLYAARRDYENSVRINTTLEGLEPGSLSYLAIYNQSTEATIDIGESEVNKIGAALSSRLALKYMDEKGDLKKGFFTKDTNTGRPLDLSKFKEQFPAFTKVFTQIEEFEHENGFSGDLYENHLSHNLLGLDGLKQMFKACGADPDTVNAVDYSGLDIIEIDKVREFLGDHYMLKGIDNEMGIKAGNNLNQRNTLMSDMAEALGRPKLLAKSRPMTIIENGEAIHGNFMENADGFDYNDIDPKDPYFNNQEINIDYAKIMADVTDMMVLDYICLNGDRHQNNMFYHFSKDEDGNIFLDGLQGIDNDLSFGNKVPADSEAVKYIPPLGDFPYITKGTKEKVMELTYTKINAMLTGKGLSDDEVMACWKRTHKLQEMLQNGQEIRELETVDPELAFHELSTQFSRYPAVLTPVSNIEMMQGTYSDKQNNLKAHKIDFVSKKQGHYSPKDKIPEELETEFKAKTKKEFSEQEKQKRIESGLKGLQQKVYVDSKSTIKAQSAQISKLYSKLWSPGKKDISQYKDLYNTLKDLNDTLKSFKNDKGELGITDDMKQNILAEKFKDTEKMIKAYQDKISKNPTRNDRKRIAITESIKSIAIDNRNSRERQVNELNTIMAKAFKTLGNLNRVAIDLKAKDPNGIEYKIAEMELKASSSLAADLGNAVMPKGQAKLDSEKDLARLCIVGKLKEIKVNNPDVFKAHAENLQKNPEGYLENMTTVLFGNDDFKKIVAKINPANAIQQNLAKHINGIADDLNIYEKIGVGPSSPEKAQVAPSIN